MHEEVYFQPNLVTSPEDRYSKTCVIWPPPKRPKIGLQVQLSLNVGQKYCRMLQGEHSAILLTLIKLPFVIKIFVGSIFEWPFAQVFLYSYNVTLSRGSVSLFQV